LCLGDGDALHRPPFITLYQFVHLVLFVKLSESLFQGENRVVVMPLCGGFGSMGGSEYLNFDHALNCKEMAMHIVIFNKA
jgi:hypothetical protein